MGIGKQGMNQDRDSVSEWRIYLPTDQDRDKYVKDCFMSGTVSLINGDGEFKHRVKIDTSALQRVVFPKDKKSLGSPVLCLSAPYSGQLYVVAVFSSSSEFNDLEEQQYRLYKANSGSAELKVDGAGKISLSVDSEDDTSEVALSITSKNKKGRLKAIINGDTLVQTSGVTELISGKSVKVAFKDKDGETSVSLAKDEVKLTTANGTITIAGDKITVDGKIYLGASATEPILLGTKTAQLLSDLLQQLSIETAGPYPLVGKATYVQLKAQVEQLKSQLAFVK